MNLDQLEAAANKRLRDSLARSVGQHLRAIRQQFAQARARFGAKK